MPGAGPEPWKGSGVRWGRSWARVSGGCHRAGVSLGRGPCLRGVWFSSTPPASPAVPDRCLPSRFSLCLSRTFPSIQLALAVASSCISPPPGAGPPPRQPSRPVCTAWILQIGFAQHQQDSLQPPV